jgi:endonuclease G
LSYNEKHEQANWVAYELTKEKTNKIFERTNRFETDPSIKTGTATENDYKGSGFDRGHLAPAGDMGWSSTAMQESFYYSNISPQYPGFNRGIWKRLEDQVRTWAAENEIVYIVTGPVLNSVSGSIGPNNVSIPQYFYKVVLDYRQPDIKGIGFIMPNSNSTSSLQSYAVTIDSVEHFTGIDFFPSLPNEQEKVIESSLNLKLWSWNTNSTTAESNKLSTSVQCNGITKSGSRCRNKTLNENGFCHLHQSQLGKEQTDSRTEVPKHSSPVKSSAVTQCTGITKSGNRCQRMTTNANGRCYQH